MMADQIDVLASNIRITAFDKVANGPVTEVDRVGQVFVQLVGCAEVKFITIGIVIA